MLDSQLVIIEEYSRLLPPIGVEEKTTSLSHEGGRLSRLGQGKYNITKSEVEEGGRREKRGSKPTRGSQIKLPLFCSIFG